ncbi:sigma-70 family RNA polymerase sigma factor [Paenibacillus wulumuqiensis]|uniref:sigma-70 family RNA polymerase sigma factor n=1 Tax=Paenibacillus wulumuqiensis TaxID=1567107 RepID=UPI000619E5A7|nr:sigma-70 family RNA polymerase sigma factor [Paenibacillus wulumuqiensis]
MEERELAAAACNGDEESYYRLVSLHRRRLYGIAYGYMRSEEDALEMLQEVTYRGLCKCHKLRAPDAFIPWLIRILIHCCMDELKRRKRNITLTEHHTSGQITEMKQEDRMDLERALDRLKPNYRHVLVLKYYDDMTVKEIARVLKRSEGTIKTWLHQGLKQIRGKMHIGGELPYGKAE